jgi:hypothetical protein
MVFLLYEVVLMDEFQKLKQIFYENILHGLFNYKSTNAEINKLLDKFSDLIFNVRGSNSFQSNYCNNQPNKVNNDTILENGIIREVDINDLVLYSIFKFLHEDEKFGYNEKYEKIIQDIYLKLDKLIYPYPNSNDDIDIHYFVEVDIEKEENERK